MLFVKKSSLLNNYFIYTRSKKAKKLEMIEMQ